MKEDDLSEGDARNFGGEGKEGDKQKAGEEGALRRVMEETHAFHEGSLQETWIIYISDSTCSGPTNKAGLRR